jgi:hypothetical protein
MTRQQILQNPKSSAATGSVGHQDPASCLPQTYEIRGVRTPFTTRALRYARVMRDHRNRLMVNLPGLSGGMGTYEMPLDTMRELFDLSVHDRMLFDKLSELRHPLPENVRACVRDVWSTGIGGVMLAREAIAAARHEAATRELGQMTMLFQALRQLGGNDVQDMEMKDLATAQGQKRVRSALNKFAETAGVANDSVVDSLGEWSTLTAPVGLATEGCAGPLRDQISAMHRMGAEVEEWSISEMSDIRFMATRVINGVDATHEHAMRWLRKIDHWNNGLGQVLTSWKTAQSEIEQCLTRLWWLLDGWEELLQGWSRAKSMDRVKQREVLEEIASFMPILPLEELEPVEHEFWVDIRVNQMLWARELRKLGNGEIDADTVGRLERYRRQSA